MSENRISVLVWASSESSQSSRAQYRRELADFDIFFTDEAREAAEKLSKVKILLIEMPNSDVSDAEVLFSKIRELKIENQRHLLWIFVGLLNADGMENLARFARMQRIERWRYLKTPLLEGEVALQLPFLLEEELESLRRERFERFKLLKTTLRGLGHEFANQVLRVIGRAELAHAAFPADKNIQKVQEAGEMMKNFVHTLQTFARIDYNPAAGKISTCLEAAGIKTKLGPLEKSDEEPIASIDSAMLTEAFRGIVSYLSKIGSDPSAVQISEISSGYPGVKILFQVNQPLPNDRALSPFEFGGDLSLPIARQIIEVHGGIILLSSDKGTTEVSVWLPWR